MPNPPVGFNGQPPAGPSPINNAGTQTGNFNPNGQVTTPNPGTGPTGTQTGSTPQGSSAIQPSFNPATGFSNPMPSTSPSGLPFTSPQGTGINDVGQSAANQNQQNGQNQQGIPATQPGSQAQQSGQTTTGTTGTSNQSGTGTSGTSNGSGSNSSSSSTNPYGSATGQAYVPPTPAFDDSSLIRAPQSSAGGSAAAAPGSTMLLNTNSLLRGLADLKVANVTSLNGGDVVNIGTSWNQVQVNALGQSLRANPQAQKNAQAMTQMLQQRGLVSRNQYVVGFVGGKAYIADVSGSSRTSANSSGSQTSP